MDKLNKLQEEWKSKLTKFIADHPSTDDTPDAILQLGKVNEFFGAKTEDEAKAAYGLLVKNFPTARNGIARQGCLDRLTIEGKQFDLTGADAGRRPARSTSGLPGTRRSSSTTGRAGTISRERLQQDQGGPGRTVAGKAELWSASISTASRPKPRRS